MFYIIPLGTTRSGARIPYVTFGLILLNLVFFLGTWYGPDTAHAPQLSSPIIATAA